MLLTTSRSRLWNAHVFASFAEGFFRISLDFLRASSGFCQLSGLLSVSLFSRASLGVNEGLIEVR